MSEVTLPTTTTREEGREHTPPPDKRTLLSKLIDTAAAYTFAREMLPINGFAERIENRGFELAEAYRSFARADAFTILDSSEESARLAERVRVLEGELKKIRSVIPMNFLIAHDTPGATGPTDALDLVGAIRSLVHNARKWEDRARSLIPESNNGGEG